MWGAEALADCDGQWTNFDVSGIRQRRTQRQLEFSGVLLRYLRDNLLEEWGNCLG